MHSRLVVLSRFEVGDFGKDCRRRDFHPTESTFAFASVNENGMNDVR